MAGPGSGLADRLRVVLDRRAAAGPPSPGPVDHLPLGHQPPFDGAVLRHLEPAAGRAQPPVLLGGEPFHDVAKGVAVDAGDAGRDRRQRVGERFPHGRPRLAGLHRHRPKPARPPRSCGRRCSRDRRTGSVEALGGGQLRDAVVVVAEQVGEHLEGVLAQGRRAAGRPQRAAREAEAGPLDDRVAVQRRARRAPSGRAPPAGGRRPASGAFWTRWAATPAAWQRCSASPAPARRSTRETSASSSPRCGPAARRASGRPGRGGPPAPARAAQAPWSCATIATQRSSPAAGNTPWGQWRVWWLPWRPEVGRRGRSPAASSTGLRKWIDASAWEKSRYWPSPVRRRWSRAASSVASARWGEV